MLRRRWRYGQKRLGMQGALDRTPAYRQRPMIPVARIMRAPLLMALAQLGSLRAMRTTSTASRWRAALRGTMPSDDTLGRGLDGVGPLPLRRTLARRSRVSPHATRHRRRDPPHPAGLPCLPPILLAQSPP